MYTIIIMGGSHVRFSKKIGTVRIHDTLAVAAPMLSISFSFVRILLKFII